MRFRLYISSFFLSSLVLFGTYQTAFAQKKKKNKKEEPKEVTKYERANAEYLLIDAQKYFLLEDYDKAKAFLEQSLGVDPKNHAAHFKLAEIHFTTKETEKGLESINQALGQIKDNKYYYLLAAQLHKQNNDLESAALAYEQMVERTADYHDYLLDMSDVYVSLSQYDKAIAVIDQLETKFGKNGRFTLQKVSLLLSANRNEEAIDLVKELIDSGEDDEKFVLEYANLVSSYRSVQEAVDFLEARERTHKMDLFLVRLYLDVNQHEKASGLIQNAMQDPLMDALDKLTLISDVLESPELSKNQEVLLGMQKSLETQYPNDPRVLEMSGRMYQQLAETGTGNSKEFHQKAVESFIKVKDLNPGDFEVWNRILNAEFEAKDWNSLLEHSSEALDLFPNQGLFYYYNGVANMNNQDVDEASASFKQGAKMALSNSTLSSRIKGKQAELLLNQGDVEAAFHQFEAAINLENSHPEVLNTYSFQLALRKNNLAKALDISKQLLALDRSSLEFIFTRGFALFQAEQFADAERVLDNEIVEERGDGKVLELYGDILFKLNKAEEALEKWQKAKAKGGTSDKIDQKIATKQYNE